MQCEVPGCTRTATEVHHIKTIGRFGDAARIPINEVEVWRVLSFPTKVIMVFGTMYKPEYFHRCDIPGCSRNACDHTIDLHHMLTIKRYGEAARTWENEYTLCRMHHIEAHTLGVKRWAVKYRLQDVVRRAQEAVWKRRQEMDKAQYSLEK